MTENESSHLTDDHLLQSVVAETELSVEMRAHLTECSHCQRAKRQIEQDLELMGQFAGRFAPRPRRRPVIDFVPENPSRLFPWRWTFSPFIAAAAAVVIITGSIVVDQVRDQRLQASLYEEMLEDEAFMAEISSLEENALPLFYVDISNGSADPEPEELREEDEGNKTPKGDAVS
jgi:hypothetical protein